jgi:hypothetical protein
MSRVAKSKLKTSTVTIPVEPEWLTWQQNSTIAVSFIKQFLFLRGQLPSLYDALLAEEQQENIVVARGTRNKRRSRDQRRRANFLASAEDLFTSLTDPSIFSSAADTSVLLLLGPSPSAPREVFELVFPPVATLCNNNSSDCSLQEDDDDQTENITVNVKNRLIPVLQARCRHILRDYMMQAFDLPEGTAPDRRCKIYILVSAHGTETPRGFKLRRGFALKKGVHTRIVLQQGPFDDFKDGKDNKETLFLQSTAKLQGLVQPPASV